MIINWLDGYICYVCQSICLCVSLNVAIYRKLPSVSLGQVLRRWAGLLKAVSAVMPVSVRQCVRPFERQIRSSALLWCSYNPHQFPLHLIQWRHSVSQVIYGQSFYLSTFIYIFIDNLPLYRVPGIRCARPQGGSIHWPLSTVGKYLALPLFNSRQEICLHKMANMFKIIWDAEFSCRHNNTKCLFHFSPATAVEIILLQFCLFYFSCADSWGRWKRKSDA